MRRILICVLFILITSAALISAQNNDSALNHLSDLSRRGELQQLIQAANSLLANEKLKPSDRGIVLMYLGHAHQACCGDFTKATAYYEKALDVINDDGLHSTEYAAALGALATVYVETGQTDTAKHVLLGSLRLFDKQGNHAMAAMVWNDLATMTADEHATREAHKYLQRALAESQLAVNLNADQASAIAATQASIDELDHNPTAAISDYQRSIALWTQSHDDQHPDTGWLYVLLGGAYLRTGDIAHAREISAHGLHLLEANPGRESPRYFAAELAYSKVLDASGLHDEASTLRKEAQAALHSDQQRAQDTVSIAALR